MAQFTTAQVAAKFETTPRTLRKFLRADAKSQDAIDTLPGKGSRYAIEGKSLNSMRGRFNKWVAAEADAKAKRAAEKAANAPQEVEDEVIDAPEVDEVDGPSDDDLAMIDDETLDLDD